MNDTCTTHRSRVPRRSFGRVKWGVTTVEDERGPGLDFSLCFVCGSHPWGAAAFQLCLFIVLLKCLECSPVPASFFPYLLISLQSYIPEKIDYNVKNYATHLWCGAVCCGLGLVGRSVTKGPGPLFGPSLPLVICIFIMQLQVDITNGCKKANIWIQYWNPDKLFVPSTGEKLSLNV